MSETRTSMLFDGVKHREAKALLDDLSAARGAAIDVAYELAAATDRAASVDRVLVWLERIERRAMKAADGARQMRSALATDELTAEAQKLGLYATPVSEDRPHDA